MQSLPVCNAAMDDPTWQRDEAMNDVDDEVVVNAEVVLIPVARSNANVLEFIIYYKSEINWKQWRRC